MGSATDFAKMVPGLDFLQGLMKNAGAGLPQMSQWIAPTLNPEELDKRIEELRTVQFWLEQNAKLLGTTIQALEVQRMTLSTLRTMNLPLADLRESLKISLPGAEAPAASRAAAGQRRPAAGKAKAEAGAAAAPAAIDPMQWWGALTQQFSELATKTLQETTADAARQLAGAVVKQSFDSAGQTLKKAATAAVNGPVKAAARTAGAVAGVAAGAASAATAAATAAVKAPRRGRQR